MNVKTALMVVLKDAKILSAVIDVFVVRDTDGLVQHVKVRNCDMLSFLQDPVMLTRHHKIWPMNLKK